jgi:hypothetical protein
MHKIITRIILIFCTFSSNAQETIIVHGYLEQPNTCASVNLKKNVFSYQNGNYVMSEYNCFCKFKVDSVISGSFLNFKNEINKPPFVIKVGLMNECTVLDYRQNYTLRIKQFPHTNYYYIDSLSQVFHSEKYSDKLTEYYKTYQQNTDILNKGTSQEKHDLLDKLKIYDYTCKYIDYRYIRHIIPYMTSKDSVTNYYTYHWDGVNIKTGEEVGGSDIVEEKGLFSMYLYDYVDGLLPFVLPDKTIDSVNWHIWYDSICHSQKFSPVKYAESEHKNIKHITNYLGYCLSDVQSGKIYFDSRKAYVLDIITDEIVEKQKTKNCNSPYLGNAYSIQNNEIPSYSAYYKGIELSKLNNGVLCRQDDKIIPLNLQYNETPSSSFTYPNLIIHNDKDFFVFTSQNSDGYNCLKAGKINRNGKWIIEPKNLYEKMYKSYVGDVGDISAFSFYQFNKNETIFAFSDRTYGRKSYAANEKYTDAIIVYTLNANLEIKDSVILTINFSGFDYNFYKTHLLKNDMTYFLVAEVHHNNGRQLYYRLLNTDLTPKTDFVKLANRQNEYLTTGKPISTSEGFMISWIDNDVSEGVLRSVLIDKSGKQSDIINITNQKIDDIFNMEFDTNHVDIYLFNKDEQTFIRKRIDKKEYN